jgi:DNA modification methylase
MNFASETIHCGDCLDMLTTFPADSVDLIYLDPPFNSNRTYYASGKLTDTRGSFSDQFVDVTAYLDYMRPRLEQLHRVLSPTGSFYYHCDWHASHYVKVMLDELFGIERFLNEIVWRYRTGGGSGSRFTCKHDVLLFYSKGPQYTFNPLQEKSYTRSRSRRPGVHNYGGGTAEFFEDAHGVYNLVRMSDVWEVPYINSQAKERLGYPTQKPLALLERVVLASSRPGDLVLDPFCGSGTTLAAARQHGRRWLGIDSSAAACDLARRRLAGPEPAAETAVPL